MGWSIGFGPANGSAPLGELIRGTSRKWTRTLNRPDSFTVQLDGRSDLTAAMAELETDLFIRRDGVALSRLRVAVPSQSLTPAAHHVTIPAFDYTWILESRLLAAGDTVLHQAAQDQADIAWRLVNATQGRSGGALGVTQGTHGFTAGAGNTGVVRDRDYEAGDVIAKRLAELAAVIGGFDYEIDAALKLQVYYPTKGQSIGRILDFGGAVTSLDVSGNAAGFANVVYVQGSDKVLPVYQATAGVGTDARGRWEDTFSYSTVSEQATIQQKADGLLAERSRIPRSYKFKMRRGAWGGPAQLDTGDTVRIMAKSGPGLQVNATARVMAITVALDEHGDEDVEVTAEQTT